MQALNIQRSRLVINQLVSDNKLMALNDDREKNLYRGGNYNGYISKATKTRISKMVENLVASIEQFQTQLTKTKHSWKIQPTFITLTLPYIQLHNDKVIKRQCLSRFIDMIKEHKGVQLYIWRAEPQENGNIHFHILIDRFVEWEWIRKNWNMIINRLDYVDYFAIKNKHSNPNSTDIHGISKIHNIASYITKYMTKDDKRRTISGRLWGCSEHFHSVKNPRVHITNEMYQEILAMKGHGLLKERVFEYISVLNYLGKTITNKVGSIIYDIYQEFIYNNFTINLKCDGS